MPEGDVVWQTAARLHEALAGRVLTVCDFRWPTVATVDLRGYTVTQVLPRGKHLLLRCTLGSSEPLTVHSHLRMDGAWWIRRTDPGVAPPSRGPIRAILGNQQWTATGHLLGMLDVLPTAHEASVVGHLGPDALGPDWDLAVAQQNLLRSPELPIGQALLDQRNLAGIGTIFMAEPLFILRINPWLPVGQVPDLAAVLVKARELLQRSIAAEFRSTTGDPRRGFGTWVHGRARKPCRRCGTPIRVEPIGVAPHDRVAFFCPQCQPSPHGQPKLGG